MATKISAVIPIFNEEENISTLYKRVTAALEAYGMPFEVLAVDDGSVDNSKKILTAIHQKDPRWKLISFSRNFGHQAAISAGLRYASGDAVAVLDADLQDPPEELHRFLDRWKQGYEVVYAIRAKRKESYLMRLAYSSFYRILAIVSSINIPLDAGDFCVMDHKVVAVLNKLPEKNRFIRGLRTWAGYRQIGISYERDARYAGKPKYTLGRLVGLALNGIISFSSLPLRMASWLGIFFCAMSFVSIALIILWWASGWHILGSRPSDVLGWTSLMTIFLFVSGLQMLLIGICGEYISRIYDEAKGRQAWIIAESLGLETGK